MMIGNIDVTYVQTSVKKMVFPMATFLNALNKGWAILGAEYKKVIKAQTANQYQCGSR